MEAASTIYSQPRSGPPSRDRFICPQSSVNPTSTPESAPLLVQFLLTLLKHLMCWAASEQCELPVVTDAEGTLESHVGALGLSRGKESLESAITKIR